MGSSEHSRATGEAGVGTTVFTDGACSGNPGPGGWAWIEPDGDWAAGYEADTTNQRMELTAVLRSCERFEDPLHIVSDSTYVVNCWRDRWWQGWLKRGWRNSRKDPVANRDLWEQVVPHFRDRAGLSLEWVKGHSGDRWNDLADRLAVGAIGQRGGSSGSGVPPREALGDSDDAGPSARRETAGGGEVIEEAVEGPERSGGRSARRRAADPRVPEGHVLVVTGSGDDSLEGGSLVEELARVLAAHAEMHPDLVVLTGLRRGAETVAAHAAERCGLGYVAVLPYPDPAAGWAGAAAGAFARLVDGASGVVVLEKARPGDVEARRASIARRDGWLRSVADTAVFVDDEADRDGAASLRRWETALGEDLWHLRVPPG